MKFRVLPAAARDIRAAQTYIAADNPAAAVTVSQRLKKAILPIAERPEIGRPIADGTMREWAVPGLPYLIPYRVENDIVVIVRVWHRRRNRPEKW